MEEINFEKMRYQLDENGYVKGCTWGCTTGECAEYNGEIPNGYSDLEEWYEDANIRAYKIVEGNLVYDEVKDNELQQKYEYESVENQLVKQKDIIDMKRTIEIINSINSEQYKRVVSTGKLLKVENVKNVYSKFKITDIKCYSYDKVRLIVTGKNMLPNEAASQTISGVEFTQNEDRSITLNGTSTENIEYNIAGADENISPIFVFKKDVDYYLSSNGHQITMYNYDGVDRENVYSGLGGVINFTEDKLVTHIVLSIPNQTTYEDITIFPQLELGTNYSAYEMYNSNILDIDFNEYIEEGLFPSDTLYPNDNLFPLGTAVDYILIEDGYVTAMINGNEEGLDEKHLNLYNGCSVIYTIQDTKIELEYSINVLDVDNLEFLQGKETSGGKFKVFEDGSIECTNATIRDGNINMESSEAFPTIKITSPDIDGEYYEKYITGGNMWAYKKDSGNDDVLLEHWYGDGLFISEKDVEQPAVAYNEIHLGFNRETGDWDKNVYPILDIYKEGTQLAQIGEINSWFKNLRYDTSGAYSLEKIKKNIDKFNGGLELITSSDIYFYNLKDENDETKKHIGLVIGENYNTPTEVLTNDNQAVDLYSMSSIAWQSVKELNSKIEKLEERIKELESDK